MFKNIFHGVTFFLLSLSSRMFLSWLVKVPSDAEQLRARQISAVQINRLEELWKDNKAVDVNDLDKNEGDENIVHAMLRYFILLSKASMVACDTY